MPMGKPYNTLFTQLVLLRGVANWRWLDARVNPPSFVRRLRHFGIPENLRPGDENLRHLTINVINFRAILTFCLCADAQRSMIGEIFG